MTKKEERALRDRLSDAERRAALRFTDEVRPDVPPPTSSDPFGTRSSGWAFNVYTLNANREWSSSIAHGTDDGSTHSSRGQKYLYSSKALALRAMRNHLEVNFSRTLREIDERIEQEMQS